jgi:hypothetical protein
MEIEEFDRCVEFNCDPNRPVLFNERVGLVLVFFDLVVGVGVQGRPSASAFS